MKLKTIYKTKTLALLVFVFSLPFEYWDPLGVASFFSVTKFAGFIYFGLAFLTYRQSFDVMYSLPTIRLLVLLWLLMTVMSLVYFWQGTQFSPYNFRLFQNVILFWLISSDIINDGKILKKIFLSFILGVFLMSVLASLGIGLGVNSELGEGRFTFFGSNSNSVGVFLSISFILIIYLILYRERYFGVKSYLLLLIIPFILTMIGLTGSRGALIIVVVGLVLIFVTLRTSPMKKIILFMVGTGVFGYALDRILESDMMSKRVKETTEEGSLAGRDIIWKNSLKIFEDKPFFGHGTTGFELEMLRVNNGIYRDTHNIFLYVLVTSGFLGFLLLSMFFWRVFKSAIFSHRFQKDSLLLVLFAVYLFNVSKAGGAINNKTMWVILAIIYSFKYSHIRRMAKIKS